MDTATRWNSLYLMLKEVLAFKEVYEFIKGKDQFKKRTHQFPDEQLWSDISAMIYFLTAPAILTTRLGGDEATMSDAIPTFEMLWEICQGVANGKNINYNNNVLVTSQATIALIKDAAQGFLTKMTPFKNSIRTPLTLILRFLDPRIICEKRAEDEALRLVQEELKHSRYLVKKSIEEETPTPMSLLDLMDSQHYGQDKDVHKMDEVKAFLDTELEGKSTNLLKWWDSCQKLYPALYKLALDYLFIPVSSVPSERANSIAENMFDNRGRLQVHTFKAHICANSWLKLFEKLDIQIPLDTREHLKLLENKITAENPLPNNSTIAAFKTHIGTESYEGELCNDDDDEISD